MLVFDGKEAYIGSANLTGAGIGMKTDNKRNFEAGILTFEVRITLFLCFEDKHLHKKEDFAHALASFPRLRAMAFSPNSIFAPVITLSLSRLNLPRSLI